MSEAFHSITATRDTPLFIFGDHASRYIPPEYADLGLSREDLTRHIAWDIGTEILIRELCAHYGCAGHVAGFSRLLIDPNRDLTMQSLIPITSDGTPIPGNQNLTAAERQARIDRFYMPYHNALAAALDRNDDPLVLSVHSFTDHPANGPRRMTEIGLLVKHDPGSAESLREIFMRMGRNFTIGMNTPYSAYDLNHTIDTHVAPRGFRHLAIEVRQDHLDSEDKARDIAHVLAGAIKPIVGRNVVKPIGPGR